MVLDTIPDSVAQHAAIEMAKLPRIMASCDGIIKDSESGQAVLLVEAKHRFPYVQTKDGLFTFMGKKRRPIDAVSVEYYAQCQLQMLVTGLQRCDLLSYSVGTSTIFHIARDDEWCSLALQILQHMQTQHISTRRQLTSAFYESSVHELYDKLLQRTISRMQMLQRQRHTEAASKINVRASDRFLDNMPDTDRRKQARKFIFCWKPLYTCKYKGTVCTGVNDENIHVLQWLRSGFQCLHHPLEYPSRMGGGALKLQLAEQSQLQWSLPVRA